MGTTLNCPASLGRVSKILKKWEGATNDEHRDGQAMMDGDQKLLVTDKQKANAFVKTYAQVSRHVRNKKVDLTAKRMLSQPAPRTCDCRDRRTEMCAPFSLAERNAQIMETKMKKTPGPDGISNEMLRHFGPIAKEELLTSSEPLTVRGAPERSRKSDASRR